MPDSRARFRETMLPHLDAAYNFARYLSGDAIVAEDIVQEAFLRAFKAFDTHRDGAPKAWLFAIVRNCWRDRIGEQVRRERVMLSEVALSETQAAAVANVADDATDTPEAALARMREVDTVRGVIADLPEPFRETLVLREIEELSYREIAALTAVPIGTVMSRLARAREMLAKLLLPVRDQAREERQA
ncbi:sigma-70 family RNA polymerase sigma factor [Sphingomonas bacterium]|uniref:sigma-70 family RNA polymerase sigma factor n=1 Tax=Sphingomonas bacterium TaxID=1895847 RepID=UPI00261EE792|nr:sigma-70 family RNA polymerase sigma factor [Sphingomonas bacterium]